MYNENYNIKIMQQVINPQGIGGVSAEYNSLVQSSLNERYNFVPLILKKCNKGINYKDISFYYKEIKKENPDIVHVRGAAVDGLNAIIAAKIAKNCKVLVTVHGMYSDMIYIGKFKKYVAKFVIEPLSFFLADGISCVCNNASSRKKFKKYTKKMLPFVYNRIPRWDEFNKEEIRLNIRKMYNIGQDDIVGLYCGRITKEKGVDYLITALESMSDEWNEKFKVIFVGDGDATSIVKSRLHGLIKENKIICVGAQSKVYKYFLSSDFFIQPSLHENHSISLIESCFCGIPSIATNVGGNTEIIFHKKNGLIIEPFNSNEIVTAINLMINDNVFRREASKIAREEVVKRFNDEIVDKQLDSVYQILYNKEN